MRIVSRPFFFPGGRILITTLSVILISFRARSQMGDTNTLKMWLSKKSIKWSAASNGFWTGVQFDSTHIPDSLTVLVLSSNKTEGLVYVLPPRRDFQRLELRDPTGAEVYTRGGRKENDGLPQRIPISEIPHSSDGKIAGHGTIYHHFFINQDYPTGFDPIAISKMYQIKTAGVYALSVSPAIYKFETNGDHVDRVDLPCVRAEIFLQPTSEQ